MAQQQFTYVIFHISKLGVSLPGGIAIGRVLESSLLYHSTGCVLKCKYKREALAIRDMAAIRELLQLKNGYFRKLLACTQNALASS